MEEHVCTLTVGTMNFGGRTPEPEARRIVDAACERGVTAFDTANAYGDGESERILGTALRGRREHARIATKVGLLRRGGKPEGLSALRIAAALDESLQRLRTDYVDLYYLHAPDPSVPLTEALDALQPLCESGKVRSWGVSNFASWKILELQLACDARGMPRPAVSQVLYNVLVRQLDLEYFAFCAQHPIHTSAYNPLAGGLLARDLTSPPAGSRLKTNALYQRRYGSDALRTLAQRYQALAQAEGMTLLTFAYAWLAGRAGVDSILAGPGTVAHLEAALAGMSVRISAEARTRADAIHRDFIGTDASYAR